MGDMDLQINVEPGLFEWLAWYDTMPRFLEPQLLASGAKYRVNAQYVPIMSTSELATKKSESTKEHFQRVGDVVRKILDKHPSEHAVPPSLLPQLRSARARSWGEL